MKTISHTTWASFSDAHRERISESLRNRLMDIVPDRVMSFVQEAATQARLAQMKAVLGQCLAEVAAGDEVPPFWVDVKMENEKATLTLSFPAWRHDCDMCRFLGHKDGYDLYRCAKKRTPTFVARFGDAREDYKSGAAFVGVDPAISEAARRAADATGGN